MADPAKVSRGLDLRALEYALLVDEQGSFRRAALAMQVRTSVISRRVQSLEDVIGVSLFHRTAKGAQVTDAGAHLLQRGREILAEIEMLKRAAGLRGRGEKGCLRVGIGPSIASGFARHLLDTFITSHSDIELDVVEGSPAENAAAIRLLKLDLAIVMGIPLSPGCDVETLWHERVFVALPADHPLAAMQAIAWKQLANEHVVLCRLYPGPEIGEYIIRGLADLRVHLQVSQVAVRRETLLALVGLRRGLSLVGEAEADTGYPGVAFRQLEHEQIPFAIILSAQNDNPALRRFLSLARRLAAERRTMRAPP